MTARELLESNARTTLTGGVVTLVVGVALVGTGSGSLGAVFVLAGALVTVLGIHTFGRLGPEDVEGDASPRNPNVLRGLLVAVAGLAAALGTSLTGAAQALPYAAIVAGGVLATRGGRAARGDKTKPKRPLKKKARHA